MLGKKKSEDKFNFENLEVWQKAVELSIDLIDLSENINTDRRHYRLIEQFEAATTSIPMNIAEGKGRQSKKEFIQFLYIAKGSLFEVITLLVIFHKKKWISDIQFKDIKNRGEEIGKMISKLISAIKNTIIN